MKVYNSKKKIYFEGKGRNVNHRKVTGLYNKRILVDGSCTGSFFVL